MRLFIYIFFLLPFITNAQTLNLPPRNPSAPTGTEFIDIILNLSLEDREDEILNEISSGNIPDFYRNLILIRDSIWNGSSYNYLEYYVIPDYLAVGTDTNFFLCPMTPILGQKIADTTDCILPTRKMVDRIAANSTVKMQPQSIPPSPDMITVPIFVQHDTLVQNQRVTFLPGLPYGELTSGDKKDVVISNLIYTSPPPRRVVIYGWHYPNGSNIQPLYAGHIDTYADYSHGIRLVQKEMFLDGVPTQAEDILSSTSLYSLLSDEGVINVPRYPIDEALPSPPTQLKSFCVLNNSSTSLQIKLNTVSGADSYDVYKSTDGTNFSLHGNYTTTNFTVTGLTTNIIYYFKIKAKNTGGSSPFSEVLAAVPSSSAHRMYIINGFDRATTGNTYNFIRQHGSAVYNYGLAFSSATNDAVTNGLITLNSSIEMVDYILGEESTADETFSNIEQTHIKNYLDGGGKLFVSGAEIGWDLDHLGSVSDSTFYADYLKAQYIYDAPNDLSATYYSADEILGNIFQGIGTVNFDNGTNGIYNVKYPDVISPLNGSSPCMQYSGLSNQYAAVRFEGVFPNGTNTGKLVNIGIPFETFYPESKRFEIMSDVITFFEAIPTQIENIENNANLRIYPNPAQDYVIIELPNNNTNTSIDVIDALGKTVIQSKMTDYQKINTSILKSGIYTVIIKYKDSILREKMVKN
ncbi:MAG: T9SS type A sorting domain-containing protein [Flavobacteriales bacterium]|nr:T9SS type A sorting domain-containing protein [Flavobacteriales bacterium]